MFIMTAFLSVFIRQKSDFRCVLHTAFFIWSSRKKSGLTTDEMIKEAMKSFRFCCFSHKNPRSATGVLQKLNRKL